MPGTFSPFWVHSPVNDSDFCFISSHFRNSDSCDRRTSRKGDANHKGDANEVKGGGGEEWRDEVPRSGSRFPINFP
jgi:hypothetical protein